MIRAIVVDDEKLAQDRIISVIGKLSTPIDIIAVCSNGIEAVEKVNELKPDLIFLDIQMPGKTGFEVIQELEHSPSIIFTTAYDQYALRAFEENSIAYLLKPIEQESLQKAMDKFSKQSLTLSPNVLDQVRDLLKPKALEHLRRLQVKVGDRILLLDMDEIFYFESEDKYTSVYTQTQKFVIDTPLVDLEKKVNPEQFMRIHRSCLVNISSIGEIHKHLGGKLKIILKNQSKTTLVVSRSFTDKVRAL
ncbi:LytTR family transcriptional regulator DNA-binding domain-containing protein [bacterium]|nr:LytTR family transcriptional regulator DNA-binding domain-containing protein [bacterium]